ncbi:UDP-N-acetylmuramoyl-L-alanyl-D-glutamate--2,6-diaminopimelate ligase [Flavobacteriaceae bacterium]|uniref:UDP-N-acetylmuramoyl-L-alanyl-D-glutamate--2, 6-diaminopimelate ligase n=1 Tax=Candidatus Arcticimaribacter forsetii TaxID=2820661 RepID=UPI0020774E82|nr:UDP-N-acetylmuramoyl-L-alanyl-D-glutamate--2,6-diaminopimelate ligase [Candidatus Arcticimaribacter forsetii]MDA8699482.1 UDP-N-acetylmuramoyl-L-alanyl-D-glutamate--2,6-diaminopimelate ligase [Flavobacteriaceae bacterium]MDB2325820.1 UDP-N-acetylmuramoyl-L-alanyl-D-glutamate--2,6-diaminopimelate ligase [Flavobacteriaceae bacterium]MDB2329436.1 UDP-N-acetylmuramoyl-L-alanyl-D-glutamate--2,6-diaminopimelate ligase [Flavobacteriaceae bacterium]MDB2345926.1 UDP-N-acetylmuramoyl-L-alanyl-D-glutam
MKELKDLLFGVSIEQTYGSIDKQINKVAFDSRKVEPNTLFVAIEGDQSNGHDYIEDAIKKGATVILVSEKPKNTPQNISFIRVNDTRIALAVVADNYYDHPSRKLELVGVTGTNGKTTVASLCYELFTRLGYVVGLLSTVEIKFGSEVIPATHTTPDPLSINFHLDAMVRKGVSYCFMEVSSHGIDQGRIHGLQFKGGVFTNLTQDHLDYHETFASYRDTKKRFFDLLPKTAFCLVNLDDKNGAYMVQNTKANKKSFALENYADFRAQILEHQFTGMLLKVDDQEFWTQLLGAFNASNLLAVYAIASLLEKDQLEVLAGLSSLKNVSGRFETIQGPHGSLVIVDYAHTPDALKNVIKTINSVRTRNEKLITVVGCGGDRDQSKRPKMAAVAANLSDRVIFTSDNPRSEDPDQIIADMEAGVAPENYKKTLKVNDRKEAIKTACMLLEPKDVLLIAGKGHETYQEIKGVKTAFDDRKVVQEILLKLF